VTIGLAGILAETVRLDGRDMLIVLGYFLAGLIILVLAVLLSLIGGFFSTFRFVAGRVFGGFVFAGLVAAWAVHRSIPTSNSGVEFAYSSLMPFCKIAFGFGAVMGFVINLAWKSHESQKATNPHPNTGFIPPPLPKVVPVPVGYEQERLAKGR
jgi:lysylphosphatidylglycerol synthetase-like protein (DUF2156 family)